MFPEPAVSLYFLNVIITGNWIAGYRVSQRDLRLAPPDTIYRLQICAPTSGDRIKILEAVELLKWVKKNLENGTITANLIGSSAPRRTLLLCHCGLSRQTFCNEAETNAGMDPGSSPG